MAESLSTGTSHITFPTISPTVVLEFLNVVSVMLSSQAVNQIQPSTQKHKT